MADALAEEAERVADAKRTADVHFAEASAAAAALEAREKAIADAVAAQNKVIQHFKSIPQCFF